MSDMFISTSCVEVFELAGSIMANYLREATTFVMTIDALDVGENPPCLEFIVCSSWS